MAIQCSMCSEILVEGREIAGARPAAMPDSLRTRAIPVHAGCCPECMGMLTAGAVRLKAAKNQLSAA